LSSSHVYYDYLAASVLILYTRICCNSSNVWAETKWVFLSSLEKTAFNNATQRVTFFHLNPVC